MAAWFAVCVTIGLTTRKPRRLINRSAQEAGLVLWAGFVAQLWKRRRVVC
jgi:hypothetical protein